MKKIILARHGQAEGGAQNLIQGSTDLLTNKGMQQAQELAQYVANKNIQYLVTSPSYRALQTATIVSSTLNIPILVFQELKEIDFGKMIGQPTRNLTIEEAMELGQAENPRQVFVRVRKGWENLVDLDCEGAVLVISHRSILSAIEAIRSGGGIEDFLKNRNDNEGLAFGYWKEIEF